MKTLIKNGLLIDPANQVQAYLNLILEDGKVVAVTEEEPEADRVIDATGKVVAPGFIDIHMHEDPVKDGKIEFCIFDAMLRMGVTTAVGGNCGISGYGRKRRRTSECNAFCRPSVFQRGSRRPG